jgi:hypothetical protein
VIRPDARRPSCREFYGLREADQLPTNLRHNLCILQCMLKGGKLEADAHDEVPNRLVPRHVFGGGATIRAERGCTNLLTSRAAQEEVGEVLSCPYQYWYDNITSCGSRFGESS